MEHVETPNVSDGDFTWTLRHFGIVLEDEAAVMHSPEFRVGGDVDANGNEASRWRLEAWCGRACPNSAVRVNVRLVNLNNFALRGRYTIKAFWRQCALKTHRQLAAETEDAFLRRNLAHVSAELDEETVHEGEIDTLADRARSGVFIGWSGAASEYLTRIVYVRVRIFGSASAERLAEPRPALVTVRENAAMELENKWRALVLVIHQRLVEEVRARIKEQLLLRHRQDTDVAVDGDGILNDHDEEEAFNDTHEQLIRAVCLRLMEHVRARVKEQQLLGAQTRMIEYV